MYYKYKVEYYDSYSDEEHDDEGMVYANSYGDAAEKVVDDYGPADSIISISLEEIYSEGTCISRNDIECAFR